MVSQEVMWTLVGFTAGFFTSVGVIPQIIKVSKTKKVDDLSIPTMILFSCGAALWFLYGIYLRSWPMIIVNVIFVFGQAALLIMKLRYSSQKD